MMALPGPDELTARASAAAAAWRDEEALPLLHGAVRARPDEPRGWHLLGLAYRNLDERENALPALHRAAGLVPRHAGIAHALARTTLEAGLTASSLFARARSLAPLDGSVLLGSTAAFIAEGQARAGIELLEQTLVAHPEWYEGHATLARLYWATGQHERHDVSFVRALARRPRDGLLWRDRSLTALRVGRYDAALAMVADARRAVGPSRTLDLIEAATISERDGGTDADASYVIDRLVEPAYRVYQMRHLLRRGFADAVVRLLEPLLPADIGRDLWPLLGLAWRLVGDERAGWLDRDDDLVKVFDLADCLAPLDDVASCLRELHVMQVQPLDQSVRGGTQTDGPLFARLDWPIRRLREAALGKVREYVAGLPPRVGGHPFLSGARGPLRFAGSWSVRLTDGGHHVEHVHPQGWISSAFYVAVPETTGGDRAGWLTIGDVPSLGLPLAPVREIEPRPGRLVLFPSTSWHRTRPFAQGERLTVAFDIAQAPG